MNKIIIASVLLVAFVGAVRANLNEAQIQMCLDKLIKTAESVEIPSEIMEVAEVAEDDISKHFKDEKERMNFIHLATKFFHKLAPRWPGLTCFNDEGFRAKLEDFGEDSNNPHQDQVLMVAHIMGFCSEMMQQDVELDGAELDAAQVDECVQDYVKNNENIEIPKEIVGVAEHVKKWAGSTKIAEYLDNAKADVRKFVAEQADRENIRFLAEDMSTTLSLCVPAHCANNMRFLDIVQKELGQTDSFKPIDYIRLSMMIADDED